MAIILALAAVCLITLPARAQVVWEDFQGQQGILGSSNNDKLGPNYNNNAGYTTADLALLRAISANSANATRTGSSATIDYRTVGVGGLSTLCNSTNSAAGTGYDATGLGDACINDAQGRVLYALVKFNATGTFTFGVAHDDAVDLDLSSDYANTAYKTVNYDLPVGDAASYTANDTTYENLAGVFSSPSANACILMRLYWNNNGGINFLRLRWTKPGGVTEIVPASQLLDPGNPASSAGCSGGVTTSTTALTVNKVIGTAGRTAVADQFTVAINTSAGALITNASTAGSGTGQQASTGGYLITAGTTYQVTDAMSPGSTTTLTAGYTPTIACTRNGVAFTPGGAAPTWTVSATAANQQLVCNITNSRKSATLRLRKTWVGAIVNNAVSLPASTGFVTNTTAFASVANTANDIDTSGDFIAYVGETGILTGETFSTGTASHYLSVLGCSAGTLSGTNGQVSNSLSVPLSAAGTIITCTWTNTYRPPLAVSKTSVAFSDPISGVTNPKYIPGGFITYLISVTSPAAYTVTNNSIFVVDQLPPQVKLYVGDLGAPGTGPITLTQGVPSSTLNYTFSGHASTTDDLQYSNDGGLTWTYVPTAGTIGPDGTDSNITHIRVNPKGTMAASSSFSLTLRAGIK